MLYSVCIPCYYFKCYIITYCQHKLLNSDTSAKIVANLFMCRKNTPLKIYTCMIIMRLI